jgi:hypothetical protein
MDKEFKFIVGIPKVYFPREIWPTGPAVAHQQIVMVKALNRPDAAHKAWLLFGNDWLSKMSPKQTSVRYISLDVNDPLAERGKALSNIGRLPAIRVYSEGLEDKMSKAKKLMEKFNEQHRGDESNNCQYFTETGECSTGCKNVQVLPGHPCPFYNPALGGVNAKMWECPCFVPMGAIEGDRRLKI